MIGIIIDILIIAVAVIIVLVCCKKGAVKSIMSLLCAVASLLLSYAFTPVLSAYLKNRFFLEKFAAGIKDTVASLAETGANTAEKTAYDISHLMDDSQFLSLLSKYRVSADSAQKTISGIKESGELAVEKVAEAVAEPISKTVSDITAFVIIFLASLLVLSLVTFLISVIFKLPVLKEADKTAGLVLGIVIAVFFILVFSMVINNVSDILTSLSPATFPHNFTQQSVILRFLSDYNIIGYITEKIGI